VVIGGIGFETAVGLADKDATVILVGRNAAKGAATQSLSGNLASG